jgi:predicted RNA polymerase sigma factor
MREMMDAVYHAESCCVIATSIRLLGNFDLAGEALYDVFRDALEQCRITVYPPIPGPGWC